MRDKSTKAIRITATIAAIGVLLMGVSVASPAYALQPYAGAYTDQAYTGSAQKGTGFSGRNDFSGTTTTTPREGWVGSLSSTGTFASTSATAPTGWAHQMGTILFDTSNALFAQYNIINDGTCVHSIGSTSDCVGSLPSMGNYGETVGSATQIDFVYTLATIDSNTVNFYWEPTKQNGNIGTTIYREYPKSDDSDPSNQFGHGTKTVNMAGTNYKFKFYQFGVEAELDNIDQTWKLKQYDNVFHTTILSTKPARSVEALGTATNGAFLTYSGTSGCPADCLSIGQDDFDGANLDANAEDSSIPKGTSYWKKGTKTAGGTQLWT